MTSIKIIFETNPPIFSPNCEVFGSVLVETSKPIKADQILLKVSGKALTSFFRSKPKNTLKNFTKPLINYKSEEIYLNEKYILWQNPSNSSSSNKFPIGTQKFDFVFILPKNCEPSFACKEAKVVYSIKADIIYSKKSIANDETVFNVSSNPDLTLKDVLGQLGKKEAKFLSNHSSSKPVETKISIPKKVYSPDEQLKLTIEITNNSSTISIDSINTGIIALAYFKGQAIFGKTNPIMKEETESIKSQEGVLEEKIMVKPESYYKYTRLIKIPKLIPSIFESNFISTVHTVYVTIHSSNTTVLIGSLPIVISTHISSSHSDLLLPPLPQHPSQCAHAHLVPPPRFNNNHHQNNLDDYSKTIPSEKHSSTHPPLTSKYSNASNASSSLSRRSPYSSLNTSTSSLASSNSSVDKPKKSVRFNDELNIKFNNDHILRI